MSVYDAMGAGSELPPLQDARHVLMLQSDMDGATVAGIVASFASVWDVRAFCRRGFPFKSHAELVNLIRTCLQCPW